MQLKWTTERFYQIEIPLEGAPWGVYVIWTRTRHGGYYVPHLGQGRISTRILRSRRELFAESQGQWSAQRRPDVHVSWAEVPADKRQAVAAYLSDRLKPALDDTFKGPRLEVNLPFG